eukprot:gene10944-14695_t
MEVNHPIKFYINGKLYQLKDFDSTVYDTKSTLLQFLRANGLTGTKLGCGEGGCGACTVMMSYFDNVKQTIVHNSVNSCLTPLLSLDGYAIITVEGIGGLKIGLHPIQERLATMHGSQCGFCTPGIIMSIYSVFRSNPLVTPHEIEEALDGNLCRCTGYRPIIDSARSLSNNKPSPIGCCGKTGEMCPCNTINKGDDDISVTEVHSSSEKILSNSNSLNDDINRKGLTEPIFPPDLMNYQHKFIKLVKNKSIWFQPITLEQLLDLKLEYHESKLVVGNTEVGIEVKFKAMEYSVIISPTRIAALKTLSVETADNGESGLLVGSGVTINSLREKIITLSKEYSVTGNEYQIRGLIAIKDMLTWFASNQIRNVACIGGNIVTASPISDLNPMLIACGAVLHLTSKHRGTRLVPISQFFLGYRKVDLENDEILSAVFIPFLKSPYEFVYPFKQARRREDDISIVTSGMRFKLSPDKASGTWVLEDSTIAFGGMAVTAKVAAKTTAYLSNKPWNFDSIQSCYAILREEFSLPENVPGGQAEYRMSLVISFLFKSYLLVTSSLQQLHLKSNNLPQPPLIDSRDLSGSSNFVIEDKPPTRSEQNFVLRQGGLQSARPAPHTQNNDEIRTAVGQSLMHKSASAQVCGDARYTGDMPLPQNAVHACLVTSTKAHAKIISIDLSQTEKCEGFISYFGAKDITGSNHIGAVIKDEEVFSTGIVKHYGAVIGTVIANTHEQAVYAARKVNITYEDLTPIISIADAIASNSFFPDHHVIESGDLLKEKEDSSVIVSGVGKIGGQDHFYLETNCTIVLPTDNGNLEVYSSTQNPTKTQNFCASVCGIPASKVVSKCKRMGGGFGGKETRSVFIACVAAIACHLLNRPISINVERDVDMSITGQRHAFEYHYSAGCDNDGTLRFLDVQLYSNAGFSLDLSQPVMDRALFHTDNVYKWPALRARGSICRTNQPSHTAFRGFGGPQGLMVAETVIQHLAEITGFTPEYLKEKNLYQEGDRTHFKQELIAFNIPSMWQQILSISGFSTRRESIQQFNKDNRWRKRGISIVPTKFGISFTAKFMNQGGALVHVYADGSVLISHGETSTSTVANSSPTAASMSTDMYGMAVLDACQQILERLEPVRKKLPTDATWEQVVTTAFFDRIDLSAHGFYIVHTDRCGYDWTKEDYSQRGTAFNYFTQGIACSEVEIDCLTGDSRVLRADILMDLGQSVNPAIDIGQIEGAFIQGYGWSTMEELVWGDSDHPWVRPGQLFTKGPGTYKIPAFNDVPLDFRVHLTDTSNQFAIHSSKAVGEPPFFLGCSTFFAMKDAIIAARKEIKDVNSYYPLDLPATSERIRMACVDTITQICMTDKSTNSSKFHPKGSR